MAAVGAEVGDCAFFAAGKPGDARALLGAARLEIGHRLGLIDPDVWSFVWVVDAPMFEEIELEGGGTGWTAVHHPFTAPRPPGRTPLSPPRRSAGRCLRLGLQWQRDRGGSVRIHRADVQRRVFDVLGLAPEEAAEQFGFLLEAFKYGPPPHGGIAFGWDRIVMLLAGAHSLREVIAFPKTGAGYDPLTSAPTRITEAQRAEAGVDFVEDEHEGSVEHEDSVEHDAPAPTRRRLSADHTEEAMARTFWIAVGAAGGIYAYRKSVRAAADARERGLVGNINAAASG